MYRFGAALIVALCIGIVFAAGASAHAPRLALNIHGALLASPAVADVSIGENAGQEAPFTCFLAEKGELKNDAPLDRIATSSVYFEECKAKYLPTTEYSVTGALKLELIHWTGAFSISGSMTISEPGPCIYRFTHMGATTTIPGLSYAIGTAKGYPLKGSNLFCEPVQTEPLVIFALPESLEFPTTELQY